MARICTWSFVLVIYYVHHFYSALMNSELNLLPELFTPVKIGAIDCKNRVLMAPLTRCRAQPDNDAPQELNIEYYRQRAGAGLIISEATQVHPKGKGYVRTPGVYSPEQEAGWRPITEAVHAAGGKIIAQLWHVGAISHPDFQPNGDLPVAASAQNPGGTTHTPLGKRERVTPRALRTDEIPAIVEAFRHSAELCKRAGFDGVEIHGANGYLLENFTRDSTNHRTDAYGGSVENRIRLSLEVVDAAISVWGKDRVGIRLSPVSNANNCPRDSNPQATYGALVKALNDRKIAFIHFIEGQTGGERNLDGFDFEAARHHFGGTYIANNRYTGDMAAQAIRHSRADAVAFGVPFISNPDLPERLRLGAPLNEANSKTYYGPGPVGYTDYPALWPDPKKTR
jgi:N-ethylmaleimide reductase